MALLLQRDGVLCACGCGKQIAWPLPGGTVDPMVDSMNAYARWAGYVMKYATVPNIVSGAFSIIAWCADAEVEHTIPLFKTKDMPDEQRGWYFTVANLALWNAACHRRKTRLEAVERAHIERLERRRKPKRAPLIVDGVRLA